MGTDLQVIPEEVVMNKIYQIRGQKVMLDSDLAELYGVETRVLTQAVRRNLDRFPGDFMFQLSKEEFKNLISQTVTSNLSKGKSSWGGTRKLPYAFTEQGVAMLSSVLRSKRAIQINIHIMRVYTKMREMLITHNDLLIKLKELESKVSNHDTSIKQIFSYLEQIIMEKNEPLPQIGFKQKGSSK